MIRGSTEVLCVFGDPIAHTLSPLIQQVFIEQTGDDYVYVPFHVTAEHLEEAVKGCFAMGVRGINCTIPHKQAVMAWCRDLSSEAKLCGAVNTLEYTSGGYVGHNTDIYGFTRLAQESGIHAEGQKVLILGAGGAAHSAVTAAIQMNAAQICVCNRTESRAEALVREFSAKAGNIDLRTVSTDDLSKEPFPIVFQTTSAGMSPHTQTVPVETSNRYFYSHVRQALDMVYRPEETLFIRTVRKYGGSAEGGLLMLFYQGLRSYEIWTGRTFSRETIQAMRSACLKAMRQAMESRQDAE